MKKFIENICPAWLKEFDTLLMVNRPLIWASRIHYLLYAEMLLLAIGLGFSSLQPVSYKNIPSNLWVLTYGLITQIGAFFCWVYFQRITDIKLFHGIPIRLFPIRVSLLFFIVTLLTAFVALIPYWHLDYRIRGAIEDTNLPSSLTGRYNTSYDDVEYEVTKDSTFYRRLMHLETIYKNLEPAIQKNFLIANMGEADFENMDDFLWHLDSEDHLEHYYSYTPYQNVYYKVYFNSIADHDSVKSDKFEKMIYRNKFKIQYRFSLDAAWRDSLVDHYYFSGRAAFRCDADEKSLIVSSPFNVQYRLIVDKVFKEYCRSGPVYIEGTQAYNYAIRGILPDEVHFALQNYAAARKLTPDRSIQFWFGFFWIITLIALTSTILNSTLRLLGYRNLFLGILLLASAVGVIIGLLFILDGDIGSPLVALYASTIVAVLLIIVKMPLGTVGQALFCQVGALTLMLIFAFVPSAYSAASDPGSDELHKALSSFEMTLIPTGFFLITSLYIYRLFHLYIQPVR